jgi:hypothetical protein
MGGRTMSARPEVIAREQAVRATRSIEDAVRRTLAVTYPYLGAPPTGAQIDATLTTLRVLAADETYAPIVRVALGIEP